MTDPNSAPDDEASEAEAPADTPVPTGGTGADELPDDFHGTRTQVIETGSFEMPSPDEDESAEASAPAAMPVPAAMPAPAFNPGNSDDEADDGDDDPGAARQLPEGRAHECLEIRTPLEEFETYVRARIDTLNRLGERERAEVTIAALELGKRRLARITGVPTK